MTCIYDLIPAPGFGRFCMFEAPTSSALTASYRSYSAGNW
ncbi:MAG: hypothetical protein [Olavius algarvensis Gamma 1 endosymbiont]|nr:MAG: hypothetical protein [Olavius algarvensis Gamma 1 endosymbiont]